MREIDLLLVEAVEELKAAAKRNGSISRHMLTKVAREYGLETAIIEQRFTALLGKSYDKYKISAFDRASKQKIAREKSKAIRQENPEKYAKRYMDLVGEVADNGKTWMVYVGSYEDDYFFAHHFLDAEMATKILEWQDLYERFPGFVEKLLNCQ